MYTAEQIIDYIVSTLDSIEVKGTANMYKIIGCVEALKELRKGISAKEETDQEDGGE